jgi:molybdenum cofactor cytidylyltransferase
MQPFARTFQVGVVILAAGQSLRMGTPKLLLRWGRTSVIGHLLQLWRDAGAAQVIVVHSPDHVALTNELDRLSFPPESRVINPAPERGMFSSIQCAAAWHGWKEDLTHFMIGLGDQPQLRAQTLADLLQSAMTSPEHIWQPLFAGHGRHPVLFPRSHFVQLARTEASTLKQFLAAFPVSHIEINDPGLAVDIDYPDDYQKALRLYFDSPRKQ